jgi:ATP-dependent Lon protease
MKEVILPDRNEADVEEIPKHERGELKFHYAEEIGQALAVSLEPEKPVSKVA